MRAMWGIQNSNLLNSVVNPSYTIVHFAFEEESPILLPFPITTAGELS